MITFKNITVTVAFWMVSPPLGAQTVTVRLLYGYCTVTVKMRILSLLGHLARKGKHSSSMAGGEFDCLVLMTDHSLRPRYLRPSSSVRHRSIVGFLLPGAHGIPKPDSYSQARVPS